MENNKQVLNKEDIEYLTQNVKKIQDFPSQGVLFYDLFSILGNVEFSQKLFAVMECLISTYISENNTQITHIVGLESRGFLLGMILSDRLKLPFVPVRKKKKLPGKIFS